MGCSRQPSDKEIAQAVQARIQKENAIAGQVGVESAQGIVTLNGQVSSDAARVLAANEAARAPGVKEVVNNLTVTPPSAAPAPMPAPAPARSAAVKHPRHRTAHRVAAAEPAHEANSEVDQPPPAPASAAAPAPAVVAAAPAPPPPPPPPAPVKYVVPAGSVISVRLIDSLDSARNQVGDVFRATLHTPIHVDGETVIPEGAAVEGRVVDASNAGRFSGHSELKLELTKLTWHGHVYPLQTAAYDRSEASRGRGTAETVGGGAALGAIIGAIAGGGRGAAIGGWRALAPARLGRESRTAMGR